MFFFFLFRMTLYAPILLLLAVLSICFAEEGCHMMGSPYDAPQSDNNTVSLWAAHPTVKIVSANAFCFFLPPGPNKDVASHEDEGVPYCTKPSVVPGNKVFPKNFITVAHYAKTPNYVQVTGYLDPKKFGLIPDDQGGQYDNHGAGKPPGAQCAGYKYFVNLVEPADKRFCIRCCRSKADCNTGRSQYGCLRVVPGDYSNPKAKGDDMFMNELDQWTFSGLQQIGNAVEILLAMCEQGTAATVEEIRAAWQALVHQVYPELQEEIGSQTFTTLQEWKAFLQEFQYSLQQYWNQHAEVYL